MLRQIVSPAPTDSRRRPRIALLADFPWSFFNEGATGRGGGQGATWLSQLSEEFGRQTGFEFHWVSLARRDKNGGKREWNNQYFHRIPSGRLSVDLLLRYLPVKIRLMRALRAIGPDLVHCWGSEQEYAVVCDAVKVPTVFSVQGVVSHLAGIGLLPPIWQWKEIARWEPRFLRSAKVITAESRWAAERIREVHPQADVRQVEYGVNPSFYQVPWVPDTREPYAIFAGAISRGKGIDVLLDALKQLGHRKWRLKVAGDGELREAVARSGIPGIELLPMLKWDQLQKELAGALCLLLPTRADSSPNVVKEARVIGLPVVTTPHGGQSGYILDGINGFMVEPLEANGLAAALSRLMDNIPLALRMGKARHEEDREYFQPRHTVEKFLAIYRELLNLPAAAEQMPRITNGLTGQ